MAFNPTSLVSETFTVTRIVDGREAPVTITEAWACKGRDPMTERVCNLVWQYRGQAIECAARGHRATYRQFYGKQGEVAYPRTALNRQASTPVAPAAPVAPVLPADPIEQLRVLANSLGYRISKLPAKAAKPEAPLDDEDLPF